MSSNKVDRKRIDASKIDYTHLALSRGQSALGKDVICREISLLEVISLCERIPRVLLFSSGHRLCAFTWPTDPLPAGVYRGLRTVV